MMEQTDSGHDHSNIVLITEFNDQVVPDQTAGLAMQVTLLLHARSMLSPKGKRHHGFLIWCQCFCSGNRHEKFYGD